MERFGFFGSVVGSRQGSDGSGRGWRSCRATVLEDGVRLCIMMARATEELMPSLPRLVCLNF